MSIINRMLQELDRRHAAEGPSTAPGTSPGKLASNVRTVKPAGTGLAAFWWIVALVVLAAATGVAYVTWYGPYRQAASRVAPASPGPKAPAAPRTDGPAAAAPTAPSPASAPAAPPASPPSGTPATQGAQAEAPPLQPPKVDMLRLTTEIDTPIVERRGKPAPAAPPRSSVDRETVRTKPPPAAAKPPAAPEPAQAGPPSAQLQAPPKPAASLHALRGGATDHGRIDKRVSQSTRDRAEGEFRRAMTFVNQGRMSEGMDGLRSALALDPTYEEARQTLVSLLLEAKRTDDAAVALEEGLALNSFNSGFAMLLARIRVERGNLGGALDLLQKHESAAQANGEYRAFVAALLQRLNRHDEAIREYLAALTIAPGVGAWWIGLGISQESSSRGKEAAESFRRAKLTGTLNTNLAAYADQRLRQLQ